MSLIYLVYSIIQILEKEIATLSNTPAWKLPWVEEPGRLQSMGSQRVVHEQLHFLSFCNYFWRRKWQCTPVFLPGESHGQRDLVGYSLWGCKESDTLFKPTICLFDLCIDWSIHCWLGCLFLPNVYIFYFSSSF